MSRWRSRITSRSLRASRCSSGLRRRWHAKAGLRIVAVVAVALVLFLVVWFRNGRRSGENKYVLGTARQLSAAADQYFLENGVSTVSSANLIGSSNYVKAINPIAGETYPAFYTQGVTITVTGVAGTKAVTWEP